MNEWDSINCAPDTHMLVSLRQNTSFTAWKALAEIIDNSFDSGATRVEVERVGTDTLIVTDNGRGCSDVSHMLRLGAHFRSVAGGMSLGRYGIGLKESSVWLCSKMKILTDTGNLAWEAIADWDGMIESKQWDCAVRKITPTNKGTAIYFENLHKDRLRQWGVCQRRVQELFTPGLLLGKQILWDGEPLPPCETPILENRIDVDGEYEGKEYELIAGIIPKGSRIKNGYQINYHHRVIASEITQYGFGEYSAARVFVQVSLFDAEEKWSLSRFKDGIDELETFLEHIKTHIMPILERAKEDAEHVELASMASEIERQLNEGLLGVKEKRPNKPNAESPEQGDPTGRKRRRASIIDITEAGSVTNKSLKIERFKLFFDWNRHGEIGKCDGGKIINIHINPEHPLIKRTASNPLVIHQVAVSLLAGYLMSEPNGQEAWPFAVSCDGTAYEKYIKNLSHWLMQTPQEQAAT